MAKYTNTKFTKHHDLKWGWGCRQKSALSNHNVHLCSETG